MRSRCQLGREIRLLSRMCIAVGSATLTPGLTPVHQRGHWLRGHGGNLVPGRVRGVSTLSANGVAARWANGHSPRFPARTLPVRSTQLARTIRLVRAARRGASVNRSPLTRATASAPMNQLMSACNWVTS
jgi:hypothetical protein